MMQYIISLLIIVALAVFYKLYFAPKKALLWYKNTIQGLGYKVKMYPFEFLGCPIISEIAKNTEKYQDSLYNYKTQIPQYDVLVFNTLSTPTIELLNPELIKSFYQPDNVYVHHKMKFMIQNIQRSLGHGIAFSEDKEWKRKRTIMNAVFNYDFIIENIPKINRICDNTLKSYEQQCSLKQKCETVDEMVTYKMNIYEIFAGMFSNVMLQCFFGTNSTNQKIDNTSIATFINTLNSDITMQTFQLPVLIFGKKFVQLGLRKKDKDINRRITLLRELAKDMIEKRLAQLEKQGPREKYQDIIQALVLKKSLSQDSSNPSKVKIGKREADNYDFKELIEEFCTFFTAGTDTTSHFTQMMVFYISENNQIEQKLRNQINEFIKTDQDINKQNLKKLTYIDWIQLQTTRYYGPGNGIFTRVAQKDHYLSNIPIMKGTAINVQPMASHYNEKYYKDPKQFRPERWEKDCDNNHPFALGGFSGGPRTCIGKHLAYLESKIALIKFMRRYDKFTLPKKNYKMQAKFLYEPEQMEMMVTK